MMNPLYRKMFQQPGMSRQPMGILASSPELANVAAQRQPVRMANGGMNTTSFTAAVQRAIQANDKYALQELAKPANYGQAARTKDGQDAMRMATQALGAMKTQVSTAPSVEVDALKPVREAFIGSDTRQTPAQTFNRNILGAAKETIMNPLKGLGLETIGSGIASAYDYLPTPQGVGIAKEQSEVLRDPSMMLSQVPEAPATSPALDLEGGVAPLELVDLTVGEKLASTTPAPNTDNPFAVNKKPVVNEGEKKPSVSREKLSKLLQKAEAGELITGGDAPKKSAVKLNAAEAATPEAAAALSMVLPEKTSLSDMEKQAKEIMGFDPSRASESKSASFWRNLTMAGLAIAAGESDNALTNIAKGLMVGMDSYSKDIKDLNEMEAEERKEYRATLRDLVKTDKDEKIALATMQNNFNYRLADLNQKRDQFESDAAYKQKELGLRMSLANRQLEVGLLKDIATLELQKATLDETKSQNIIKNRMDKLKALPDFVQNAVPLGYGTIDEKGNFSWTEKGQSWVTENAPAVLRASITGSAKTGKVAPTREAYILDSLGKEFALDAARQDMASQGIKNPTGDQLREYFGRQYDATTAGSAATGAATAPSGPRLKDPETGKVYIQQPDGTYKEVTGE